jgi:hypothetical protein
MGGMESDQTSTRPTTIVVIALIGIVASGLLGGATNALNGAVSPIYFRIILGWENIADVWRAAIAQGVYEGMIYGVIFSALFTCVIGIVTRGRSTFGFALKHLSIAGAIALFSWCLGGLMAMALATLSADFYPSTFRGVPPRFHGNAQVRMGRRIDLGHFTRRSNCTRRCCRLFSR